MHKVLLFVGATVIILVAGFLALNAHIYDEKQGTGELYEPYRATLTGEYVCLPHTDQSALHTDECAAGIKTDVGEYFAVDFALMSRSPIDLQVGQQFRASGVITPVERLSTDHWRRYPVIALFSVTDAVVLEKEKGTEPVACTADAKLCPDGSAVGRSGPNCEFAACPAPSATSARVTTYMGGTATALTVSVNARELVSDSRCPAEVECVWAGTVEVRTALATPVSHGEHVLTLGEPQVFGEYTVTLVEVTPAKTQAEIPHSSYRFTYEIAL